MRIAVRQNVKLRDEIDKKIREMVKEKQNVPLQLGVEELPKNE